MSLKAVLEGTLTPPAMFLTAAEVQVVVMSGMSNDPVLSAKGSFSFIVVEVVRTMVETS